MSHSCELQRLLSLSEVGKKTRLPYNIRTTTRECVYLVRRGHFRSRDNVGGHAIWSAISENPMLHANFMSLFYGTQLSLIEVSHCRNEDFFHHFAPVTLTLIRWPSYTNLTRMPWTCENELPMSRFSKLIVRQKDTIGIIYHARRF